MSGTGRVRVRLSVMVRVSPSPSPSPSPIPDLRLGAEHHSTMDVAKSLEQLQGAAA